MNIVKKILPHICIILAGMMITFYIINQFNDAMGLMTNDMTQTLVFLLAVVSVIVSAMLIFKQRRED